MTRHGNIVFLVLVVIALVSTTAAGYFYLQTQKLQTKPAVTPLVNPTLAPGENSGWKTYKNADMNFSISYPGSWKTIDPGPDQSWFETVRFEGTEGFVSIIRGSGIGGGPCPGRLVDINAPQGTLKLCNAVSAATEVWHTDNQFAGSINPKSGGLSIYFSASAPISPSSNRDIILKTLSTFQLLAPLDKTAGWRTYMDQKNVYTFKYPLTQVVWEKTNPNGPDIAVVPAEFDAMCKKAPCTHTFATVWLTLISVDLKNEDLLAYLKRTDGSTPELKQQEYLRQIGAPYLSPGQFTHRLTGFAEGSYSWQFYDHAKKYLIRFDFSDPKNEMTKQIIETFKFID